MENVSATKKKRNESLKNRLEKRIRTEKIRFYFRLPAGEILDGKTDCVLHASFERNRAEAGTLFVFKNFLCFKSSLPNSLSLIIPMRFVTHVEGELRVARGRKYIINIQVWIVQTLSNLEFPFQHQNHY